MLAALLGFVGVLVGAILTHLFAISNEWRSRRMEAMVASVTASIRVLGAHEGTYHLFLGGGTPPLTDDRFIRAFTERNDAFTEWRIARARLEIVVSADDERLKQAIDRFNAIYVATDGWVSAYLKKVKRSVLTKSRKRSIKHGKKCAPPGTTLLPGVKFVLGRTHAGVTAYD
jgi:hypothetical protein